MASWTADMFTYGSSESDVTQTSETSRHAVAYTRPAVETWLVVQTVVDIYNDVTMF